MTPSDDHPLEFSELDEGDVLCDRRRQNCFVVTGTDAEGIALRNETTNYYVPHTLFVCWYGTRVFPIEASDSVELPAWIDQR